MWAVLNRKPPNQWVCEDFLAAGQQDMEVALDPFCKQHKIRTRPRTLLEIGCGAGRHTGHLAERFKRVVALDVSDELLKTARENIKADNVEFVRGNGVNLDVIETASMGFVWSVIVFQHIPDPEIQYAYLREVGRVLRPGGWFLIHLYGDVIEQARVHAAWQQRADAGELQGWSELGKPELVADRWKTSTRTAVTSAGVRQALGVGGLTLKYEDLPGTAKWWIGGQKA